MLGQVPAQPRGSEGLAQGRLLLGAQTAAQQRFALFAEQVNPRQFEQRREGVGLGRRGLRHADGQQQDD
ncbi:hypothetical protein I0E51_17520 [Pseudomonas lalucatii]|nr:hypothetical protein [Pseudomonas lalucatii]